MVKYLSGIEKGPSEMVVDCKKSRSFGLNWQFGRLLVISETIDDHKFRAINQESGVGDKTNYSSTEGNWRYTHSLL